MSLVAVLLPLITSRPSLAVDIPAGSVDWNAARGLPPLASPGGTSANLTFHDVQPPACAGEHCIATTLRPELEASIDPDPNAGYVFIVFDLSGEGGLVAPVAEVQGHQEPTWAPEAGLLQHGRVYAWTVMGEGEETQDWGMFVVDLQRDSAQAFDEIGLFSVGMGTGELAAAVSVGFDEETTLVADYRTSDQRGRTAGSSPRHVLSDGWALSGSALGEASWYRLDQYGGGATVMAHSLDGSVVRYERDADGAYHGPALDGASLAHLYPTLVALADGSFVMSDLDGSVSEFTSDGALSSHERVTPDGSVHTALEVTWFGEVLREITDTVTGRTASFSYLGDRNCRPGQGFDSGSPTPKLCQIQTLDGERIEFMYAGGELSRVVGSGGAVTDFAYDESGRLVAARDTLAADTVAAGLIADDADATWRLAYDTAGRVDHVTSPLPAPGAEPLVRSYAYGNGTTTLFHGGLQEGVVTFDPVDYRVLTSQSRGTDAPFEHLYDSDRAPIGVVDERGLQTSWASDLHGNVTHVWGPAPRTWFAADGTPEPQYADQIATVTSTYGGGAGMLGLYYPGLTAEHAPSAQALLTAGSIDSLPAAVDPSTGWRLLAIGETEMHLDDVTTWRLRTDAGADLEASGLVVDGGACGVQELCELGAPIDAGERALTIWVTYASASAPTPQAPAWFVVEYSHDGGETWVELDPAAMRGRDLPTASTDVDVYALGGAPVSTTTSTSYSDPLLGLVGTTSVNGVEASLTYEPADPAAGLFARQIGATSAAGLTTAIEYWGLSDQAAHPLTGDVASQFGGVRSARVGDGPGYGEIRDDTGRIVATTVDGTWLKAMTFDERGRVASAEVNDGGNALSPPRSATFQYGAGGDPRVTGSTSTIGEETFTAVATVDLLGRETTQVDMWGTTTTTTYDDNGVATVVTVEAADGSTSTTTNVLGPDLALLEVVVEAADGATYHATITGHDGAGRITGVEYSNGMTLSIEYDPITGQLAAYRWTDADGGEWSDVLGLTTQTGRILTHELSGPTGAAAFTYSYDPGTGYLTEAAVIGSGAGPASTTWTWSYDTSGASCEGFNPLAGLDGARSQRTATTADGTETLDYCYDANLAPASVIETHAPTAGDATSRELSMQFDNAGALIGFDGTELTYEIEGLLVGADDGATKVELTRDAFGSVIRQRVTDASRTTTFAFSGPFVLDETGHVTTQTLALPGPIGIELDLVGDETAWHVDTVAGDPWWRADASGSPTGDVYHFSPDGEPLDGPTADPHAIASGAGWRSGAGGVTLALETSIIVFGARAYVPALGLFTSTDPIPNAGPTPYSYADNDPVNLVDPTGNSAEGWFDDWTSPGSQMVITWGLTLLAVGLGLIGQPHLAAVVWVLLAAYLAYLSYLAFSDGDYVGGALYAVSAALVLMPAIGTGLRLVSKTAYLWKYTSTGKGYSTLYVPTQRTSLPSRQILSNMQTSQQHAAKVATARNLGGFDRTMAAAKSTKAVASDYGTFWTRGRIVRPKFEAPSGYARPVLQGRGGAQQAYVQFNVHKTYNPLSLISQGAQIQAYMVGGGRIGMGIGMPIVLFHFGRATFHPWTQAM